MRILTLDDMETRALTFRQWFAGHEHVHVYTSQDAIRELGGPAFDLIMLDHDLADEHYERMGMSTYGPGTGMDVVDFLVRQARAGATNLPRKAIIHSYNSARAPLMRSILKDLGIIAYNVPFGKNPLG